MTERVCENRYRTTVVYVDRYEQKILQGRFWNPYHEEAQEFTSMVDFLLKMEVMLEEMKFPSAYEKCRSFSEDYSSVLPDRVSQPGNRGKKGTFEIRIIFRQNASWQGTICWKEKNREESFRSVLEMVTLMDSALSVW